MNSSMIFAVNSSKFTFASGDSICASVYLESVKLYSVLLYNYYYSFSVSTVPSSSLVKVSLEIGVPNYF